jgi:hypothetical protein
LLALPACTEPLIDSAAWRCVADEQCGTDMACRAGVCIRSEGPLAGGKVCVTGLDVAQRDIRAELSPDKRSLEVFVDGMSAAFALPEEVVDVGAGLANCCESPCCKP